MKLTIFERLKKNRTKWAHHERCTNEMKKAELAHF